MCATRNSATFDIKAKVIEKETFCYNYALANLTLEADSIAEKAFYDCATNNSAIFDVKAKVIEKEAFRNNYALANLTLEADRIAENAFYGSATNNSATFDIKARTIGSSVFRGCSKLTTVTLSDTLTGLGNYAFSGCSSLNAIKIPSHMSKINDDTFNGCSSLKEIVIPKNIESVGNNAFEGCSAITDVTISDRETELALGSNGSSPLFADCPLKKVYIGGNISYPTTSDEGYSPFYRNTTLEEVVITDKETEISENEFYGCTNLKSITMGDGVESIGNWAFSGCSKLESFSFGTGMKTIGQEAFSDCTALKSLTSMAGTPPTCGSNALDDINKFDCTLHVLEGSLSLYQAADQWKEFFFILDDATGITSPIIGNEALKVKARYSIDGRRIGESEKGIHIIKYSDGTTKKVLVK